MQLQDLHGNVWIKGPAGRENLWAVAGLKAWVGMAEHTFVAMRGKVHTNRVKLLYCESHLNLEPLNPKSS